MNPAIELWVKSGYQLLLLVSVVTLVVYLVSRVEVVTKFIASEKPNIIGTIITILVLGTAICLASKYAFDFGSAKINGRTAIALFAAVVGGPIAGIAVGIIGGIYRYSLGGWTHIGCTTATVLAGLVGAAIVRYTNFRPKDLNKKSILFWMGLAFAWESLHLVFFVPLLGVGKSFQEGLSLMLKNLYIPMVSLNVIAIVTFLFLLRDMVMNDYRVKLAEQLDEQNKLIAEVEELRAKLMEKEEDSAYNPAAISGGSIEQTS